MTRWLSSQRWVALVAVLVLVLAACGGSDDDTTTTEGDTETTEAPTETTEAATETTEGGDDGGDMEAVEIRWFVGLGAGGQPEQITAQEELVALFNEEHDDIELVLEIVENEVAYDTLATQLASGNPPDIVGPVGRDGSNSFAGQFLDLEPLIDSTGYDVSVWPEAAVENFREPDGTLPGLPFGSFPSFIFFNTELFDEAGLPYPPQEYGPDGVSMYGEGTEYEGTWDFDKVREIGQILTVDANGVDATDPSFDSGQTIQWGFLWQWTSRLFQQGQFWGADIALQDDNTAKIPQQWGDEWKWYYENIWEYGISPSADQEGSDLLTGNPFSSGNIAIAATHLWYTCCVRDDDGNGKDFFDLAVMPSHEGTVTANMHADTFRILEDTEHPEEAFEVLTWMLNGPETLTMLNIYGAAPAIDSLSDGYYAALDEVFPQGVNWQVAKDSAGFADQPSHEQYVPGWDAYKLRLDDLDSAIKTNPDLDMDAEIAQVEEDLTVIFQENA